MTLVLYMVGGSAGWMVAMMAAGVLIIIHGGFMLYFVVRAPRVEFELAHCAYPASPPALLWRPFADTTPSTTRYA